MCISTINGSEGYLSGLYNLYNSGTQTIKPYWQSAKDYISTSYVPYVPSAGLILASPSTINAARDMLGVRILRAIILPFFGISPREIYSNEGLMGGLIDISALGGYFVAPGAISATQLWQRQYMKSDQRLNKLIYGVPVLMQAAALIAMRLISGESIVTILRDTSVKSALVGLSPSLIPAFLAVVAEFVAGYLKGETASAINGIQQSWSQVRSGKKIGAII